MTIKERIRLWLERWLLQLLEVPENIEQRNVLARLDEEQLLEMLRGYQTLQRHGYLTHQSWQEMARLVHEIERRQEGVEHGVGYQVAWLPDGTRI